jgi:hypothetical protein
LGAELVKEQDMQTKQRTRTKRERLSLAAEARLVEDLRAHQRRVQDQTGLRVSLSQAACRLLRRGLDQEGAAPA